MNERKKINPDKDELTTRPKTEAKGKETILVVDDEKEVRRVVVEILDSLGYEVLEAENGPSALKVLEKKAKGIDLVFSDVVMTLGMSGFELAQELRRRYPHIKVLLASGYPKKVIDNGDTGVTLLRKPYKKADLAKAVRMVLDQ